MLALSAVVLVSALVITGCAGKGEFEAAPAPAATSAAPSAVYKYSMSCQNASLGASYSFSSYRDLWATSDPVINCNADTPSGNEFSPEQLVALNAAGYEQTTVALGFLYARCADLGTNDPPDGYWSSAYAALLLCPDHPEASDIVARADSALAAETAAAAAAAEQAAVAEQTANQRAAEITAGTRIEAGIHRVGDTVQPGTFATEGELSNCYWERLASDGSILENGFLTSALRVEVTVDPTDYSFFSQRCGEWVRVD